MNPNSHSDQDIVQRLKGGDSRAMKALLTKYGDALYGAIFQIVRSQDIAKDLMQDACVKIWKNIARYDENKSRLFTWLLRVARNTAIDKVRTEKFKAIAQSKTLEETVYNHTTYSEEMNIPDSGLAQVINRLDKKYQQIINLIYLQGFTQKETAEQLDIPIGTVKSRVKTAIRTLRELLGAQDLVIFLILSSLIG